MRYVGLIFLRDDDSGMVKINVTDTLTGTKIINDMVLDLYQSDKDATYSQYEEFICWFTLPYDDIGRYEWTIEHTGYYNPSAVGPLYHLQYNGYLYQYEEASPGNISKTLYYYSSKYPSIQYVLPLESDVVTSLEKSIIFSGDNVITRFNPTTSIYAEQFTAYSVDGGINWITVYDGDYSITWGSNSPDYNDHKIREGKFYVTFNYPPPIGTNNVIFNIIPIYDTMVCEHVINLPKDGSTYTNYTAENKLLYYSLELIP